MAQSITSAAVVGCTGLVGSYIINTLLSIPSKPVVHAITRRDLNNPATNLKPLIESDSSKWTAAFTSLDPKPTIFFSALGTTRAQAGGTDNQRKIDYDLNLALAKAAKASGIEVYVLISSAGTSKSSPFAYGKMKVDLEDAVKEIGFQHTVILRPGALIGAREGKRPTEAVLTAVARGLGTISNGLLKDWWAQEADVVGRAAVVAGAQCLSGAKKDAVWSIEQGELMKLGKQDLSSDEAL